MTGQEVQELLSLHALGALEAGEAAEVEQLIADDLALRAELDALREAAGHLGTALPVVAAPPATRDRLMASLDALVRPGRFERFAARIAQIYDVSIDKARMFLGWVDDPAQWQEQADYPIVKLIHLPAGPAWAGADCGLVLMPPGLQFPWHDHKGEELTLVLQGRAHFSDGTTMGPGDESVLPPGEAHDYRVEEGGEDYIFAVRFYGIVMLDRPVSS